MIFCNINLLSYYQQFYIHCYIFYAALEIKFHHYYYNHHLITSLILVGGKDGSFLQKKMPLFM